MSVFEQLIIETLGLGDLTPQEKGLFKKHPQFYKQLLTHWKKKDHGEGIPLLPSVSLTKDSSPQRTVFAKIGSNTIGTALHLPPTKEPIPFKAQDHKVILTVPERKTSQLICSIPEQPNPLYIEVIVEPYASIELLFTGHIVEGQSIVLKFHAKEFSSSNITLLTEVVGALLFQVDGSLLTSAELTLQTLQLIRHEGALLVDSSVKHLEEASRSVQVIDAIVFDQGRTLFQGNLSLAAQAQKSEGYQKNRNLLVGAQAKGYSEPHVEIHADDVKASHGVSFSEIDEDLLFFLTTRGLSLEQSKRLLINSFCYHTISQLPAWSKNHALALLQEYL